MASLGNDLAEIRKEQNLSLEEIHQATKIPKHILASIEDDSIFTNFEENPTYIRSYVRSYAKALSIDDEEIIFALNNKQNSDYKGSLQELSETKGKKSFQFDDEQEDSDQTEESDQMHHDHVPGVESSESEVSSDSPRTSQPQSSEVRSVDWANMGRRFQPLKSTKSRVWIGVLTIIFIAAVGSYVYFYQFDSESSQQLTQSTESTNAEITSDSLQLNLAPPAEDDSIQPAIDSASSASSIESNEVLETLPDTIEVLVYAAYGKLEPVRVSTDIMGNINPYWLEEGDALRFNFVNEMRIREDTDNFVLILNGHPVQNLREQFYNPDTRLFEFNRSDFEGEAKWLQPAPDSLAIDAPPPTNIRNRPTFN